jgi:transposase-like protein
MHIEAARNICNIINAQARAATAANLPKAVLKTRGRRLGYQPGSPTTHRKISFPGALRWRLGKTNRLAQLHRETRQGARMERVFPSQASCLRLIPAVPNEISDGWLTGRTYLAF